MIIINFSSKSSNGNGQNIIKHIRKNRISEAINFSDINFYPCGHCNYECFSDRTCFYINDDAKFIYDAILTETHLIFIIPVYNVYPCSNYFAFRERMQFYFSDETWNKYEKLPKKFIIIGNTGIKNTVQVLENDYKLNYDKDILILSTCKYKKKASCGDLLDNADVKDKIDEFIKNF
ncbi:hypothetical protein ACGCUQ_01795 [Eubacteriales bacterium KG127]